MGQAASHGEEGEVDPLTEADVFMAYGRNQQAEEVLKNALAETPDRHELTAKLLEVYYSTRNATAFAALVASSAAALQANEAIWSKVVAMGHELLPDDELFAAADSAEVAPVTSKPAPSMNDDVLDIGLDLDELSAEMEAEEEGSDDLLNLDLDMFDAEDKPAEKSSPAAVASDDFDLDLDLDLDDEPGSIETGSELSLDSDALEEAPATADVSLESDTAKPAGDDFNLDFDLIDDSAEDAAVESDLDMELGDLDLGELGSEEDTPAPSTESSDALGALELEGADMDALNLDDLGGMDDFDEGMLDDADEITTKLDLAQAYIEMGDAEGARSMLEEVVEAGSEEQKKQAQELLGKI
jgi:pilus assembly protein FimV